MHVTLSDGQLYYAARGESGAPLLFLHGAGDTHLLWNGQLAAFAHTARAIALDLPGHGRSTAPARDSITAYAGSTNEFLSALSLAQVIVVGSSMGGAIALTLALDFPAHIRGLVLVGTGARLRVAPQFLDGIQTDFESTARALVENYYAPGAPELLLQKSFTQLINTGPTILAQDFAACNTFDVRDRLAEIHVPTLILCGTDDKMTPPKYSEFLHAHITDSHLVLIPNAGHMPMLEQPQSFNSHLSAWLTAL